MRNSWKGLSYDTVQHSSLKMALENENYFSALVVERRENVFLAN